jgi:hypothetical protein
VKLTSDGAYLLLRRPAREALTIVCDGQQDGRSEPCWSGVGQERLQSLPAPAEAGSGGPKL